MSQHIKTPCIHSIPLSELTNKNITLKLECLQPSGSFKDRGIGFMCDQKAKNKSRGFIASSGGNAGMAVALAGKRLKLPATIIIPTTTPSMMIDKIRALGAHVIIHGDNWNEADEFAHQRVQEEKLDYIPPFDNPLIWEGYHSLIDELHQDKKPSAIILAVGGGGLLTGILQRLEHYQWNDVAVITAETEGAATLAETIRQKKHIRLDKINTVATTLGAKQIAHEAFLWSQKKILYPQVVSDKQAVNACLRFAYDHRLLVEPACGAALSVLYENSAVLQAYENICVIVCGGNGVSIPLLQKWETQFISSESD